MAINSLRYGFKLASGLEGVPPARKEVTRPEPRRIRTGPGGVGLKTAGCQAAVWGAAAGAASPWRAKIFMISAAKGTWMA